MRQAVHRFGAAALASITGFCLLLVTGCDDDRDVVTSRALVEALSNELERKRPKLRRANYLRLCSTPSQAGAALRSTCRIATEPDSATYVLRIHDRCWSAKKHEWRGAAPEPQPQFLPRELAGCLNGAGR